MTVTAPPRPPGPSDPVERKELEALIEEARQRAHRRRLMYAAVAVLVGLIGIVVFTVSKRTQSQTASPALASRPNPAAPTPKPKIAFISEPLNSGYDGVLYVMNADGSEQRRLTRHTARGNDPPELAWSPLGNEIAFLSRRDDGNLEIYVINVDGSEQRRLTRNTVRDSNPVWSPDGRRIAFESNWQVYVMNADGSGQRRLTRNGGRNFAPAWSPDGQRIAFERRLGRRQRPACSGCGEALIFEVHVMNADGSGQQMLTPRGAKPGWSPDGRTIAFVSKRDGNAEIYVMNADGSEQRNLTRTRGRHERWFAWSPGQSG